MNKNFVKYIILATLTLSCILSLQSYARANSNQVKNTENPIKESDDAISTGNYFSAINILKPLASKGNPEAQMKLAHMYELGLGVKPDWIKAERLYKKSASQGNILAEMGLSEMYFKGGFGLGRNYKKALKYDIDLAGRGAKLAPGYVAGFYFDGLGVHKSYQDAYYWYTIALHYCPGYEGLNYEKQRQLSLQHLSINQKLEEERKAEKWIRLHDSQ